nr:MAG: DNA pilot protein [Microvirus sp.]
MSITAAAIAGTAAVAGAGIAAAGQGKANKLGAKLTREGRAYDRQQWEDTNTYNSPLMQMQRLREAGLNPNLVYDKGATSVASLPPQAKIPEVRNTLASAANMNLAPMVSLYQDWEVKKAQIDNMKKQGELLDQEKIVKALDITSRGIKNDTGTFDLSFKRGLANTQAQILGANLNKILLDMDVSRQRMDIRKTTLPYEIGLKGQQIKNLNIDSKVKQMEYDYQHNLRKSGLPIDAPWYVKTLFDWKDDINRRVNGKYNNAPNYK